jgi:hypothetical protein
VDPSFERATSEPDLQSAGFERATSEPDLQSAVAVTRPKGWRRSLSPVEGDLADPREAVIAPVVQLKLEPLPPFLSPKLPKRKDGLIPPTPTSLASAPGSRASFGVDARQTPTPLGEMIGRCVAKICSPCMKLMPTISKASSSTASAKPSSSSHPPHRWFRIHPMGDGRYFVRPDAGWRGRVPGSKREADQDQAAPDDEDRLRSRRKGDKLRMTKSTPDICERRIGLKEPSGFEQDAFHERCCICYERPIQVITLPCRHGALCEECLRRTLYSRPRHRGGRMCPICRRDVNEVVWIYGDAAIPQYGFTIKS